MVQVLLADATHKEAWERFVAVHPDAAPYHRWAWFAAIERAYGFAPVPLVAMCGLVCLAGMPGSFPCPTVISRGRLP
jgi:hypothetical protein